MKKLFVAVLLVMMGLSSLISCKKTQTLALEDPLIQDAKVYCQANLPNSFPLTADSNLRISGARTLDWENAHVASLPKVQAVVVPIHYARPFYLGANFGGARLFSIDGLSQLVIYKDSAKGYHTEMVTALPDSNFKGGSGSVFSGMLLIDQWNGQALARYKYDNHPARVWRPGGPSLNSNGTRRQADAVVLETCYELVGYNYPASNPSAGIPWQEDLGCTSSFIDDVPSTQLLDAAAYMTVAGGGGVGPYSHLNPIYPGDGGIVDGTQLTFNFNPLPAIDLTTHFKCFTYIPDQGATYSVTLCADIPVDNNSGALMTTGFTTGHAFIILTKTNGNVSLTQSFGFYPQNSVLSSIKSYVSSKISDDGAISHEYDASITMPNISLLDFQTVENEAINLAGSQEYSLYNYNCTNYALQVYNSIRINDPIAVPDWIGVFTGINFGTTPNGLYNTLVGMKTFAPGVNNLNVSVGPKYASPSAGACN